jgi:hypothetical protein
MSRRHSGMTRHTHTIDNQAKRLVKICVPDSFGKCVGCGSTVRTVLDWALHRCYPRKRTEQIYDDEVTVQELRIL